MADKGLEHGPEASLLSSSGVHQEAFPLALRRQIKESLADFGIN